MRWLIPGGQVVGCPEYKVRQERFTSAFFTITAITTDGESWMGLGHTTDGICRFGGLSPVGAYLEKGQDNLVLDRGKRESMGFVDRQEFHGLAGVWLDPLPDRKPMPVGEVHVGPVTVLSDAVPGGLLPGQVTKLDGDYFDMDLDRPAACGMSGSPLIQDGMIVGSFYGADTATKRRGRALRVEIMARDLLDPREPNLPLQEIKSRNAQLLRDSISIRAKYRERDERAREAFIKTQDHMIDLCVLLRQSRDKGRDVVALTQEINRREHDKALASLKAFGNDWAEKIGREKPWQEWEATDTKRDG